MNYTVYLHKFPNNKVYIGITSQNVNRRWRNGKGYRHKQDLVFRAIQKYGWENIEHIILHENLSKEQAEQKEIELISEYNAMNPKNGYNCESGGSVHKTLSEETRQKLRDANIGKKHTEETKRKMSISIKKAYEEERKSFTKEHWQKMRDARKYDTEPWNKGKTFDNGNHVIQLSKSGEFIKEFISISEAQKTLNIQHISQVCKGQRKTTGGYRWVMKKDWEG